MRTRKFTARFEFQGARRSVYPADISGPAVLAPNKACYLQSENRKEMRRKHVELAVAGRSE
jgi:hypothetical protein